MSAQNRTRSLTLAAFGVVGFTVIGAAAHVLLVQREELAAAQAAALADQAEQDLARARAYLRTPGVVEQTPEYVEKTAEDLIKRMPRGRVDVKVMQYFEEKAVDAGLEDFKIGFPGGIIVSRAPDTEIPPFQRLEASPGSASAAQIQMQLSGKYSSFFAFLREIAEAPWIIEVENLEIRRRPAKQLREPGGVVKTFQNYDVAVQLTARYLHQ